ncbi:GntR family transcriptional regulator [Eoetvoesiella caeni]
MAEKRGHSVDEIYRVLADRINNGMYLPGRKLSQSELANELDVSRTPLREALNRLQESGLVVATTNRGMEVAPVTFEETEQWYAMRLMIEPPIIAAVAGELTGGDLARMSEALQRMQEHSHRTKDFQDAHHAFHEVALVHYPPLIREMIESIYIKIIRHQRTYFSRPRAPEEFCDTDRLLLDALIAQDGELAKHILEFHLVDAALGLLLEADPDYVPKVLFLTASGLGIQLDCDNRQGGGRPAQMKWANGAAQNLPAMVTANVCYELDGRVSKVS